MDISFEIDENISRAQNETNYDVKLDIYHNIITTMETLESFNLEIFNQLELITYDVSEIAKRNCVLNREELINAHHKVQKYIKQLKKPSRNDTTPLVMRGEMESFLDHYAFSIRFMKKDLADMREHPAHCHIEKTWIFLGLVALFGIFAALQQFFGVI